MPHIHTLPGQIDHTVETFIVDVKNQKILLRIHDKTKIWLSVGGHIELDETGPEAATREVKEEVGIEVELWSDYWQGNNFPNSSTEQNILPPVHMFFHDVNENHRHVVHVYYARALTTDIVEQDDEKSDGIKWWTKEEIENSTEIIPNVKWYALDALNNLCK